VDGATIGGSYINYGLLLGDLSYYGVIHLDYVPGFLYKGWLVKSLISISPLINEEFMLYTNSFGSFS